jgi:putative transposase
VGEFWTEEYYVATVVERVNWKIVERYIERQGKPREDLRQLNLFN